MNMIFEFFPLLLFFGTLIAKDIYAAVLVLMIAMPIGLLVKRVRTGSLDKMYMWSTVFAVFFGALTLYFRNPYFTYWKPTAFYWVVAIAFLASTWMGDKPLAQRFFGLVEGLNLEKMAPTQWRRLNLIWVLFFAFAGVLNLYVAYNYSEATWVNFKLFGMMGLTLVFVFGQAFYLSRYMTPDEENE